jgi:hypothetical protein
MPGRQVIDVQAGDAAQQVKQFISEIYRL